MNKGYRIPKNDFEVIEKFDSYKDDDLAIKMVEFYQEQRDRDVPLEDAYLKTLQICSTSQNTLAMFNPNVDSQTTLQYHFDLLN